MHIFDMTTPIRQVLDEFKILVTLLLRHRDSALIEWSRPGSSTYKTITQ